LAARRKRKESRAKAFLKWVGGKRFLIPRLREFLPKDVQRKKYHEPFAGAAHLFFALRPREAHLSDVNADLIEAYKQVRDNYPQVATHLLRHRRNNKKSYYYQTRTRYNTHSVGVAQAARFVYLNRACFNGVFRVNKKGEFNVPYGRERKPYFPSTSDLREASKALRGAKISRSTFEEALERVKAGEFVYLDPPYPPLNGTSFFTHYTADRFSDEDQVKLARAVRKVHERGGLFLLTNADLPKIRKLYHGFNFSKLSVTRYVSCKGSRYKADQTTLKDMRDHAWDYFALHAEQRLRMFHFFIILQTALVAAMLFAARMNSGSGKHYWIIGGVMMFLSFIFWKLDQRTKGMIKVSEEALKDFERRAGAAWNIQDLLPFTNDPQAKGQVGMSPWGVISYSKCFGTIFLVFGTLGLGVLVWFGFFFTPILNNTGCADTY
jgi:DNA adenine methylase